MHKTYTIAEFRKRTRTILNEALNEPITIKRFDDEFTLSNAGEIKMAYSPAKKEILGKPAKSVLAVTKPAWCKEHNMEKEYCKGFKHK